MEEDKSNKLRHRFHQWSVSTLIKLLEEKPINVARVDERGSSSKDPFSGSIIIEIRPPDDPHCDEEGQENKGGKDSPENIESE